MKDKNGLDPKKPGDLLYSFDNLPKSDEERRKPDNQPAFLRLPANLLSYLFHPLFIPAYIAAFLIFVHPYVFFRFNENLRMLRFITVLLLTVFFPAFSIFLLQRLGFVQSVYLRTQRERIIPYITSMFFFFWAFYVMKNLPDSPRMFTILLLGVFLSSIAAFMANIYFKVSMHAIAMGGLITFFVLLSMQGTFSMGIYLSLAIFIAGLVCTARLIVSDHHPFEVYVGFFLGVICQAMARFFV
ncbi:MAG: hypothetical protein WKF97_10210 [Chitinophagaceae bacterium]